MRNRHASSGFTIVELVAVIVVIAIIATIATLSYTGVTNRAKDTATTSDVKSLTSQIQSEMISRKTVPPGYDLMKARTNLSSQGAIVYSFDGLADFNDPYLGGYTVLSPSSFKSQFDKTVKGRAGYISMAVPSGTSGQYYLAAMGVGVYRDESFVPAAQKVLRLTDDVVQNVTGWYMLVGTNMKVEGNKVVCTNGSTPSSLYGATWASINTGNQPRVAMPLLSGDKIQLGGRLLFVKRAWITCSGGGGGNGELHALVNTYVPIEPQFGYFGFYPIEGSVTPYTGT